MTVEQIEKAAYLAANRLMVENTSAPEWACPGTQRSRTLDKIATIIKEVFELGVES